MDKKVRSVAAVAPMTESRLSVAYKDWLAITKKAVQTLLVAHSAQPTTTATATPVTSTFDSVCIAIMNVFHSIRASERLVVDDPKGVLDRMASVVDAEIISACTTTSSVISHAALASLLEKRRLITEVARRNSHCNRSVQKKHTVLGWRYAEFASSSRIDGRALLMEIDNATPITTENTPVEPPIESPVIDRMMSELHSDIDLITTTVDLKTGVSGTPQLPIARARDVMIFQGVGGYYLSAFLAHEATAHTRATVVSDAYRRSRTRCNVLVFLIDLLKDDVNGLMCPVAFRQANGVLITLLHTLLSYVAPMGDMFRNTASASLDVMMKQSVRKIPRLWCEFAIHRAQSTSHRHQYFWSDITFDIAHLHPEIEKGLSRVMQSVASSCDMKGTTPATVNGDTRPNALLVNHDEYMTLAESESDVNLSTTRMLHAMKSWLPPPEEQFRYHALTSALHARSLCHAHKHSTHEEMPFELVDKSLIAKHARGVRYPFQMACIEEGLRVASLIQLEVGYYPKMRLLRSHIRLLVGMSLIHAYSVMALSAREEGQKQMTLPKLISLYWQALLFFTEGRPMPRECAWPTQKDVYHMANAFIGGHSKKKTI